MASRFDEIVDRKGTAAIKVEACRALFGSEDAIPMWVADMDVKTAPDITEALTRRAVHGIYGYTAVSDDDYNAVINWVRTRFGAEIRREWIGWGEGVVSSIYQVVNALTRPGDRIVIQTPVYTPFYNAIRDTGREIRSNKLINNDNYYTMDFEDLETALRGGARMMILCSPHNPVGRVWTRDEISRVVELCRKYDVVLISDEIHSGFIYRDFKQTTVMGFDYDNAIVMISASKAFNLAGLGLSNMIIRREDYKKRIESMAHAAGAENGTNNVFGLIAQRTAYEKCGAWLDELTAYIESNADETMRRLAAEMPLIRCRKPEGTYLMWMDMSALGTAEEVFKALCKAGVGLNRGADYGEKNQCDGYMRFNVACPRAQLDRALDAMVCAYKELTQA